MQSPMQSPFWWEDDTVPRYRFRPYTPGDVAQAADGCKRRGLTYILLDEQNPLQIDGMVCLVPKLEDGVALMWQACLFQAPGREIIQPPESTP